MRRSADDLPLALELADVAERLALARRGASVARAVKPDGSTVSAVDLEVERALLDVLAAARPNDHVLSEERGAIGPPGPRRWLIDPIDGTDAYLAGGSAWGTHIALEVDGVLEVAVLTRPAEGLRWWAARGAGARRGDGEPLRVSQTTSLARARVARLVDEGSALGAALAPLAAPGGEEEGCAVAALLERRVDALVDEGGDPWDRAPALLLTAEAGGRWRCSGGGDPLGAACVVYSNRHLVDPLMARVDAALGARSG